MLKFPYGFSDFYLLMLENHFYVDRTSHINAIKLSINAFFFVGWVERSETHQLLEIYNNGGLGVP